MGNNTLLYLNISSTEIVDMSPLKGNKTIRVLIMFSNRNVTDVSFLKGNETIEVLYLGDIKRMRMRDVSFLLENTTITHIFVYGKEPLCNDLVTMSERNRVRNKSYHSYLLEKLQ
jgi:hypothetical protein